MINTWDDLQLRKAKAWGGFMAQINRELMQKIFGNDNVMKRRIDMVEKADEKTVDLYHMELHEQGIVDEYTRVMRVPGGWIYFDYGSGDGVGYPASMVFVPYNNNFMPTKDKPSDEPVELGGKDKGGGFSKENGQL